MWELEIGRLSAEAVRAVMRMPDYAKMLTDQGKLEKRWHIVGKHGGAWIYNVTSNEELDRLLAMAPCTTSPDMMSTHWPTWTLQRPSSARPTSRNPSRQMVQP